MVLIVMILVFTSIQSLQSEDIAEKDLFSRLRWWEVYSSNTRAEWKIQKRFPDKKLVKFSCNAFYKIQDTPFAAIVLFKSSGRLLCMGSIVDNLHILSSKRCYEKIEINDLRVLVGYHKAWWGRFAQIIRVDKIFRHEYEVVLLRLHTKIKFTDYVRAARLASVATKSDPEIQNYFPPPYNVVGFAVDRYDVPGDIIDKNKTYELRVDNFVHINDCKKNYSKLILDNPKLFCVMGNSTYCWGGWGAPVLKEMGNYYVQIGVIIADQCTSGITGAFLVARTDVYGDWIRGIAYQHHQPS